MTVSDQKKPKYIFLRKIFQKIGTPRQLLNHVVIGRAGFKGKSPPGMKWCTRPRFTNQVSKLFFTPPVFYCYYRRFLIEKVRQIFMIANLISSYGGGFFRASGHHLSGTFYDQIYNSGKFFGQSESCIKRL